MLTLFSDTKGVFSMMKCLVFIVAIFSLLSACTSDSASQSVDLTDSSIQKLSGQIEEHSVQYLSKVDEDFREGTEISDASELTAINDSVRILSIPIEGHPIRKDYILFVVSDSKVFSSIRVNGNWIDNDERGYSEEFRFLSEPLVYLDDVNNDEIPELVIKDRMHNGSLFNAASKHIFSLDSLQIQFVGTFEYVSHLPIENEFLVRYWDTQSGRVDVYLKEELHSHDSIHIGKFVMTVEDVSLKYDDVQVFLDDFRDSEHLVLSLGLAEY